MYVCEFKWFTGAIELILYVYVCVFLPKINKMHWWYNCVKFCFKFIFSAFIVELGGLKINVVSTTSGNCNWACLCCISIIALKFEEQIFKKMFTIRALRELPVSLGYNSKLEFLDRNPGKNGYNRETSSGRVREWHVPYDRILSNIQTI